MSAETPVTIVLRLSPNEGVDEIRNLEELCEYVVADNVALFERLAADGFEAPCCCACAGVKYRAPSSADYEAGSLEIDGAARILETLEAACGGIACYDASAARFRGKPARVRVVPEPELGPSYYHAVVETNEGLLDPSTELAQGEACTCP